MKKRFSIKEINIADVDFLEKNAHFMNRGEFDQLTENIKKDGELTSVPVVVKQENDRYRVISGNHRVKAAKIAGLTSISVMYCSYKDITNDEILAIQISHNSIKGDDDAGILKELMDEIEDLSYKEYAFVDESTFDQLESVKFSILEPSNETLLYTFAFFNEDASDFESLKNTIDNLSASDIERLNILPESSLEMFNDVIVKVQRHYKIKSSAISVIKMMQLAKKQLEIED